MTAIHFLNVSTLLLLLTIQKGNTTRQQQSLQIEDTLCDVKRKCDALSEILSNQNPFVQEIPPEKFLDLCVIIIQEIDTQHCDRCVNALLRDGNITEIKSETETPSKYVWIYSSLAVLVINVTGMLSFAIVPIIYKYCYQKSMQFLIALAIGSLIGDALLHLLPHAMKLAGEYNDSLDYCNTEHSEHRHGHREVWIGLTALYGICFLFCAEQLLNFLHVYREKNRMKKKDPKIPSNYMAGERLSRHSRNSNGCHNDYITLQDLSTTDACGEEGTCFQTSPNTDVTEQCQSTVMNNRGHDDIEILDDDIEILDDDIEILDDDIEILDDAVEDENQQNCTKKVQTFGTCLNKVVSDTSNDIPSTHHNHTQEMPHTVLVTAWMVIAGDGFHNFSDGMAIGAAFGNSPTVGLSTSIAVFCHELPLEVGDFAMLLNAGMTKCQVITYNCVSSLLCFLGMAVGVGISNIHWANSWVCAATAGMFLYIALVDLMRELNRETVDRPIAKFMIHCLGISIGVIIMCLIAFYEHDLQYIFQDGS